MNIDGCLIELVLLYVQPEDIYNAAKACRKMLEISRGTGFREVYRIKHNLRSPVLDLTNAKKIGDGRGGNVYKVNSHKIGHVAVKAVSKTSRKIYKEGMNEISVYSKCYSPYLLSYIDSYFDSHGNLCIILELGETDLRFYTDRNPMSTITAVSVFQNLCMAIKYLHDLNFAYRDIKPENVIKVGDKFKLGDFGFALRERYFTSMRGTLDFMSPEMVLLNTGEASGYYGKPADIWALSVTLYDILYRQTPFFHHRPHKTMRNILKSSPKYNSSLDPSIREFLDAILIKDYHVRPNIDDVLAALVTLRAKLKI